MSNSQGVFDQMVEVVDRTIQGIADDVQRGSWGWVASSPSLPRVYSLNTIRIVEPVPLSEALAIADDVQGAMPFRHIDVDDELGRELEDGFVAAGWQVDRDIFMVLRDEPVERGDAGAISVLTADQTQSLMRSWTVEDHPHASVEVLDQLAEFQRREGTFWGEQCFGVVDGDGSPLAITKLRLDDSVAWVEDVYTMPEARRRGLARNVVSHVAGLAQDARREFAFILADDNDWPKHLYAEIGFRPVGHMWTFHRELEPTH